MKNKITILSTLTVVMLFLLIGITSACSCLPWKNVEDKMDNADYIFSGKVISINTSGVSQDKIQEVKLTIIEHWKPSNVPAITDRTIYASVGSGANCGYNFKQGESYLIYASIDSETGKLMTSSCSSLLLSDAEDEIAQLNEIIQGKDSDDESESNIFSRFFKWIKNLFS